MTDLTYTTIPAPDRAQWAVPLMGKNPDLSDEMTAVLNDMANKGWRFLRSETLPFVARRGLLRRKVESRQTILIFYKNASSLADADIPAPLAGTPMFAQTGGRETGKHEPPRQHEPTSQREPVSQREPTSQREPVSHAPHIMPNPTHPKTSSAPPLTLNPSKDPAPKDDT